MTVSAYQRLRRATARQVKRYLVRNRSTPFVSSAARICGSLLDGYHNLNYDHAQNGEFRVLSRLASLPLSCFFDAGANIGEWTSAVKKCFSSANVHSFEIHPQTFAWLSESTAGLSGVNLVNSGLSDRSEDLQLNCFGHHLEQTTAIEYPHPAHLRRETVTGHAMSGDSYVSRNSIGHIDFLKIDVEGMEDKVLRGFEETIGRNAIDIIQFEYGRVNILTHFLLCDFYEYLGSRGYAVGKIYPTYVDFQPYSLSLEDFRGPNYLAILKSKPAYIQLLGRGGSAA